MILDKNDRKINNYDDLRVYNKLCDLHLDISELTFTFPNFELYELGSQIRKSSNSIPANLAEGWNNRHIKIYLEGINRSLGELRETLHHLFIAYRKKYLTKFKYDIYKNKYNECGRMLKSLEKSLMKYKE